MAKNTYIVRFTDETSRARFYDTFQTQTNIKDRRIKFGEFLPDLIIYDVSEQELQKINNLAGTNARFIADFQHDLFLE